MRIVQAAHHFLPCIGGIERVVRDTAKKLQERGHEVKVVSLNRCAYSATDLPARETIDGITVERIPYLDAKYYKIAPGVLGKLGNCDAVHVHGIGFLSDFLILTKPLHRKKVFVSTHGGIFHTSSIGPAKKAYFQLVQRILLNFSDGVIAVSKNDFDLFSRVCSKVKLVENGVCLSQLKPGRKNKDSFLFVGRFSRNKRLDRLIQAFSLLGKKSATLTIAGTDWQGLLEGYERLATEKTKRVKFVPNPTEEELRSLYSTSEFFVSAAEYEGFGLSLVEAMASGCIPVVHGNESFVNIVENGKNGFITDFSDTGEAARTMATAMKCARKKVSGAAVEKSKKFSLTEKITALEEIYAGKKN